MPSIQIKNIAPLKDTGVVKLTPVMLLIGNQSSGKSTLMKILCFCRWIEKRIMVDGEDLLSKYTHYNRFRKELLKFHRLSETAFSDSSRIFYDGDCITIELNGKNANAKIIRKKNFAQDRYNLKISFIPSERNLLSAINNIDKNYKAIDPDALFNYILEWGEVRDSYKSSKPLNLAFEKNVSYYHDENAGDMLRLQREQKTIRTFYASSGIQSALPIMVMVDYIHNVVGTNGKRSPKDYITAISRYLSANESGVIDLTNEKLDSIKQLLTYKTAQLYIEEPEQNLFPKSQAELVKNVIKKIKEASVKSNAFSAVMMTTHSPYVLTTLNQLLAASKAYEVDPQQTMLVMDEAYILPGSCYSAYRINDEGELENLIDAETGLIMGEYLDSISEEVDEVMYRLNSIIYADVD